MRGFYDAAYIVSRVREKERTLKGRERNGGLRTMLNGDDRRGEGGSEEGEGVGGGGSGDVLAKVTAGNAVYVRRSKVACRVAGSLLSLSLPSPSCPLGCHHPLSPPAVSIHSSVHPSLSLSFSLCVCVSLSLFFSLRAPRHGADCRNAPNAPRWPIPVPVLPLPLVYFGRLPLPVPSPCLSFVVLRFFFLRSATPPPRAALASFTSFCRRRCHSRVRTASLAPMRWRASSPPRPPHGMYVRMVKHARTRVRTGGTQKRHVVSLPEIHTGSSIATRSHYNVRSLAPSRRARFLFLSSLPKVRAFLVGLLRRVLRSRFLLRPGMTLAHGNADPAVSVVDRRRWRD